MRPVGRIVRSFSPASMPLMSRRSYRWELTAAGFMPTTIACVEGNVVGVILNKAFEAPPSVIATVAAAPALANITSAVWTRVLHGTHRVHAINILQGVMLLCVAMIALAPISTVGTGMVVAGVLGARVAMAGVINARADVWRANYPRTDRARATGKLTTLTALIVGATAVVVGLMMDNADRLGPDAYRLVYAFAVLLGLFGIWAFSHVRWRGGLSQRRAERQRRLDDKSSASTRQMLSVLKNDRWYRRYQTAQFTLGIANLSAIPLFIVALEDTFGLPYLPSLVLTQVIPIIMPVVAIPFWARFLDRVHVIAFRAVHSWFFVLSLALLSIGFVSETMWLIVVSRFVLGVAFGGGMLAWNLGHHDFASRDMASIYMGIHATLTGVRGAVGPYIGTLLYSSFTLSIAGADFRWGGFGRWTFAIAACIGLVGALLFVRLYADLKREQRDHRPD
jgi:hypothetical protein